MTSAASAVGPLKRHGRRAGRLRELPSSFVGRDEELRQVAALLRESRLVTLTGPTGIGKSRLSFKVASSVGDLYPDGVRLVELAATRDPALLPLAVASALDIQECPGQPLLDTLTEKLGDWSLLLVLDNCEHLVEAAAALAETLLQSCPALSILATSQERLAISGERAWVVPPLSMPQEGHEPDPDLLARYEAVKLFCARAQGVDAGFRLTLDTAPHVVQLCRRLDGLPLAIELAASRVGALSAAEIATGIDDRFGLLTGGRRTLLARHKTLLSAVQWSYDLLGGAEQTLLRRMTVFSGGATLHAVQQVAAGHGIDRAEVRELLGALVDKSLVKADTSPGETRYHLLETIRHFARDRLNEEGEGTLYRDRHLDYYVAVVERAEPELTGANQQATLERLQADYGNLRCALEWAVANECAEPAMRLAGSLTLFWRVRGYFSEGREWLDAVNRLGGAAPAEVRAKALWGAGFITSMTGDFLGAQPLLHRGLELAVDGRTRARALLLLGNCAQHGAGLGDPLPLLEESIAVARGEQDSWCLAHALALAAQSRIRMGQREHARGLLRECLEVAERSRDKQSLRIGRIVAGSLALAEGEYGEAREHFSAGRQVVEELREGYGRSVALLGLGEVAFGEGAYPEARRLLEEALELARPTDARSNASSVLCSLGRLLLAQEDFESAAALFKEACSVEEQAGTASSFALWGLAEVAMHRGNLGRAEQLFRRALKSGTAKGNMHDEARATHGLAEIAAMRSDFTSSKPLHDRALKERHGMGAVPDVVESIESIAALSAEVGQLRKAARLLGAAEAVRQANGYARHPLHRRVHEKVLAKLASQMSPEDLTAALAEGEKMSVDEAVTYARRSRGERPRADKGWDSLTRAECEVATLVGENLTNQEIAERLFVSVATVKTHLSHVFAKLGVSHRRELARQVRDRSRDHGGVFPKKDDG